MAVSLRIVIGFLTALIVLVVASVTLAITYTVSVAAVRNTGARLSEAITSTVALEVYHFMSRPEQHLFVYRNQSKIPGEFSLPQDDPGYATHAWGEKYLAIMKAQMLEVNFTYRSVSLIFDDGSLIIVLDRYDARGWAIEAINTWRPPGYGSLWQRNWHVVTKQMWNFTSQGNPPRALSSNISGTVAGYYAAKSLTGGRETCIWFPPTVDHTEVGTPRYVLYGLCILFNATGYNFGQIIIGRFMDQLPKFLEGTSKTPNTHLMLVDNFGLMVGSTYDAPTVEYGERGVIRMTSNCVSSVDTSPPPEFPEIIGCRPAARDYAYAPLREAAESDANFVRGPGQTIKFGELAGENYYYLSQRIPSALGSYTLNLLVFMPESDVLGDIVAGRNLAIGITVAVFIAGSVLSFVVIGTLLAPVDDVARRMYFTSKLTTEREASKAAKARDAPASKGGVGEEENDDDDQSLDSLDDASDEPLPRSSLAEVRALQTAYTTMDTAIKSFTKYVPRDVVKELMSSNQMCEIQMRPMRCSMLFTDIVSFTSICERVPPPILSALIRQYFECSSRTVMNHGGVIDKFIGDCIMAVWGAPVPIDAQEVRASVCAHMLVWETQQDPLRSEFKNAGETLAIRAGVATGEVLAGNMGSAARMNYTVIGDDVNLASRLESLNKQWGTSVMISESTAEEASAYMLLRYVISIAVVGKSDPVKVYEVLGVNPDANTTALGNVTSDASENVTLAQARQNDAEREMAERYGMIDASYHEAASRFTAGKLLRRALRKFRVDPAEKIFVGVYAEAIAQWNAGRFGECVSTLRSLNERSDVPTSCGERLSVRKIIEAAEEQMKNPPSGSWTGVWVASEK